MKLLKNLVPPIIAMCIIAISFWFASLEFIREKGASAIVITAIFIVSFCIFAACCIVVMSQISRCILYEIDIKKSRPLRFFIVSLCVIISITMTLGVVLVYLGYIVLFVLVFILTLSLFMVLGILAHKFDSMYAYKIRE